MVTLLSFVAFVCCGMAWLYSPPSFLTTFWGITSLCNGVVVVIRLIGKMERVK